MDCKYIDELKSGTELYQERARRALPILVRQALVQEPISYSNLAEELGMPNPRNLNYVLGCIGYALQELSIIFEEEIPPINCIVHNKITGLPSQGIGFFKTIDKEIYFKLPNIQKRAIVNALMPEIYIYPRWKEILTFFSLPLPNLPDYEPLLKVNKFRPYGGGESPSHREFKEFIFSNPQILGLPKTIHPRGIEELLPSGDIVDIRFGPVKELVIVEVKSVISDEADIYRGIYQCVKYKAVIQAFQSEKNLIPNCRVMLVLEGKLSDRLFILKNLLGIEVIVNVTRS